jgi:hypothetical protein
MAITEVRIHPSIGITAPAQNQIRRLVDQLQQTLRSHR